MFLVLVLLLLGQRSIIAMAVSEDEKVDFVEVQLKIDGKIYEGLQERIEFSIARVGEKILLAQPVALLKENKTAVKTVILKVFSKVLVGFKLESVDLFLGEHTKIVMNITPIAPLISNVRVNLEAQNVNPELNHLTKEVALKVEAELNRVFIGLPVSSVSWSEGIFNIVVNYLLEREFPGFNSRFSLQAGATTELNLTLIPQEPVVTSVMVDYSATNIPVWLVKAKTRGYQEKFDLLKGIPVEFLIHYQPKLEKNLTEYVNNFAELRKLGLFVQLGIKPGATTQVKLRVDSQYVQTRFEGGYFISNEQAFGNIQAYLGYRTSDFVMYTRYYWGENSSNQWKVGCGVPIEDNFTGGLEFELEHSYRQAWLHYNFERGDYLDLKLGINHSPNEATVGIHLNRYTNLELVDYANNFGLQFIFHF